MSSSEDTFKRDLKRIVASYKLLHHEEYQLLVQAVVMKRKVLVDPKYATFEGSREHRALFEISEKLHELIVRGLQQEGLEWFKTIPGARWFANTFKEFTLPKYV